MMDSRYPFNIDFSLIEKWHREGWDTRPSKSQKQKTVEEYEQTGYLGKPVGTIWEVRNVTEKVRTAKFSPKLALKLSVWLFLTLLSIAWSISHLVVLLFRIELPEMQSGFWSRLFPGYDFWYWWWAKASNGLLPGNPYFESRITGYLITHTLIGAIAAFVFFLLLNAAKEVGFGVGFGYVEDKSAVSDRIIISSTDTTANVLIEEVAVVYRNGECEEFMRKAPDSRYRFKPLQAGQKISRYNGGVLFQEDMDGVAFKLRKEIQIENAKEQERALEEFERRRQRATAEAERLAEKAKRDRIAACRFDNWRQRGNEAWVFDLPEVWLPFVTVGLAYANVVSYGSLPPEQQRRPDGTLVTVGVTPIPNRGVYLIGPVNQRTINKVALVVDPLHLPGTTTNDLVIFGLSESGGVLFIINPARHEKEIYFRSEEANEKFQMIGPVLAKLFDKAVSTNDQSGGWA